MRKAGLVEGTLSLLSQPKQGASKQALLLTDCVNLAAVSPLTLEGISDSVYNLGCHNIYQWLAYISCNPNSPQK